MKGKLIPLASNELLDDAPMLRRECTAYAAEPRAAIQH
jgi:hypothetical protein